MQKAWLENIRQLLENDKLDRFGKQIESGLWLDALSSSAKQAVPLFPAQKWKIVTEINETDPQKANVLISEDFANGTNAIRLTPALTHQIPQTLLGIDLETIGVLSNGVKLGWQLTKHIQSKGFDAASLTVDFGLNTKDVNLKATVTEFRSVGFKGPLMSVNIGSNSRHLAVSNQLGLGVSEIVECLRLLENSELSLRECFSQLSLIVNCNHDFLLCVAKLRALHKLWYKLMKSCGIEPIFPIIHAETASRLLMPSDIDNNIIRNTIAAMAAAHGGISTLLVKPHDSLAEQKVTDARRLARNTQLIIRDEVNAWRVGDSFCGSGTVEHLTNELAEQAWMQFTAIEEAGGFSLFTNQNNFEQQLKEMTLSGTRSTNVAEQSVDQSK
jgi:methylmalonyl-CoA mutase